MYFNKNIPFLFLRSQKHTVVTIAVRLMMANNTAIKIDNIQSQASFDISIAFCVVDLVESESKACTQKLKYHH